MRQVGLRGLRVSALWGPAFRAAASFLAGGHAGPKPGGRLKAWPHRVESNQALMIQSSIFWLRVAACLYALGLLHSMFVILRHKQSVFRMALASFRVAVV